MRLANQYTFLFFNLTVISAFNYYFKRPIRELINILNAEYIFIMFANYLKLARASKKSKDDESLTIDFMGFVLFLFAIIDVVIMVHVDEKYKEVLDIVFIFILVYFYYIYIIRLDQIAGQITSVTYALIIRYANVNFLIFWLVGVSIFNLVFVESIFKHKSIEFQRIAGILFTLFLG